MSVKYEVQDTEHKDGYRSWTMQVRHPNGFGLHVVHEGSSSDCSLEDLQEMANGYYAKLEERNEPTDTK